MNLLLSAFGYYRISADAENCTALLNLCMERRLSYTDFRCDEGGGVSFTCSAFAGARLIRLCRVRGIAASVCKRGGVPHFLWRYRQRWGMALGVTIGFLLLQLSGMFVWDVRVSGNVTLSEEEVCASLRACGFGVGSRISDASLEQIENRVLIESDRIAWISVYMDGTVAVVQIRENEQTPPAEPKLPANLIAACDGQIEYLELYRGDSVVKVGQAVKAGDLLVSGVYDSQTEGVRYTRAAGQVLARVEEEIVVEIPLFDTEKRYLTDSIGEIWLDFFDFSIKIFKNSRNPNASCDIIEDRKEIDFWGLHDLPFGFRVQRLLDYTLEPIERTASEAEALAYARLDEILAENAEEVMLLQKTIQTSVTEQSVILTCKIVCIKNIAVQSEFEVLP